MSQLISNKLPRHVPSIPFSTLTSVLVAVVAIAALYFGREVLVPIALALLLSFVLALVPVAPVPRVLAR
jgi:predicted PurR-regulated permease PerM